MFKKITLSVLTFFCFSTLLVAQVGIGTTTPAPGAMLDIDGNGGILIPRIALTATTSPAPISPPAPSIFPGVMVYNTASVNDVTPGFYYWNGAAWERMASGASTDWALTGNAGTTPGTNFIGTTDAQDLVIATDGTERMRVDATGNVGINTAPAEQLHVDGNFRLEGAFMPGGAAGNVDQILISKGTGNEPEWDLQITNLDEIQGLAKFFANLPINPLWSNNTNRTWAINAPGIRLESNVNVNFIGFPGACFIITNISVDTDTVYVSIRNNGCGNIASGGNLAISLMIFY